LLNRFETPEDERCYVGGERARRRFATRMLILISLLGCIAMAVLNPIFFPPEALVTYNIVAVLMITSLGIAFYVVGTRQYLEWPWLDFLMFVVMTVGSILLLAGLASTEETTGTTFLGMAVIYIGMIFVYGSIAFVANVRLFLLWAIGLMATYVGYIVLAPIPVFPKVYLVANGSFFFVFAIFVNWEADRRARIIYSGERALEAERVKTEALLYNVLPQPVAERLRAGEVVADAFSDVTVIFVDIVGFSRLAQTLSPGRLVQMLNRFFMIADECAERHGIEKVKTIGDAYLAVSGGTASRGHGAKAALAFGRELIAAMTEEKARTGIDVQIRIGLHTGPVIGGVVGKSRFAYDYWGDTMNIASRIEGSAEPGGISVSAATFYECEEPDAFHAVEAVTLKGVGETVIYRLKR
jgi:class 3 adenylate cyclase